MVRRPWTHGEDDTLKALVSRLGDKRGPDGQWDQISRGIPGRTKKDCRKRWFHSLDPSVKKGRWTAEEDNILLEHYNHLGPAWKEIALQIPGRKDDQCSKRYCEILDPLVKDRLRDWSTAEDSLLTELVAEFGSSWSTISSKMDRRTALTCRNRWRRLSKKGAAKEGARTPEQVKTRRPIFTSLQQMLTASTDGGEESSETAWTDNSSPTMVDMTNVDSQSYSSSLAYELRAQNLLHGRRTSPRRISACKNHPGVGNTSPPLSPLDEPQINVSSHENEFVTRPRRLNDHLLSPSNTYFNNLFPIESVVQDSSIYPLLLNPTTTTSLMQSPSRFNSELPPPMIELHHSDYFHGGSTVSNSNSLPWGSLDQQILDSTSQVVGTTIEDSPLWPIELNDLSNPQRSSNLTNYISPVPEEPGGGWLQPHTTIVRHHIVHHHYHHYTH